MSMNVEGWELANSCTCGGEWPCGGPDWMGEHTPVMDDHATEQRDDCDPYCMAPFGSHHPRCPAAEETS